MQRCVLQHEHSPKDHRSVRSFYFTVSKADPYRGNTVRALRKAADQVSLVLSAHHISTILRTGQERGRHDGIGQFACSLDILLEDLAVLPKPASRFFRCWGMRPNDIPETRRMI